FKVADTAGNENTVVEQTYMLDTTLPDAVDLSTDSGGQNASMAFANIATITAGVAFDASIQAPTVTDIKTIKVVLAGASLSTTHDKLVLDSDLALDVDIATATGKTIGGVGGLEYSYTVSSNTWTISKTSGNLTTANVKSIVEALKLKNEDTNSQEGVRTATISYIDTAGNEGVSAMASLRVEANRGFAMNGEVAGDESGYSVSNAGDVNGDGLDDLIVGAVDNSHKGKSYVVFGKTSGTAINLSDITSASGTGGFLITGEKAADYIGFSVSSAGDVNGDGLDDLIVGTSLANKSYVVFGKDDGTAVNIGDIASASGTGGFIINGESESDRSGYSVSSAGDVNGDGLDDLIIGAIAADPNGDGSGKSYVVFGKADNTAINLSAITSGTGGFVINGEKAKDHSGHSVSSAGDVNGDGLDDLIVGAYGSDSEKGKSYVVFGKTNGTAINLSDIASASGTGGFVINGEAANDYGSYSVSSAGDVNGDGLDDLIVGALTGKSYVVFGKTDTNAINISDIAQGIGGFVINGKAATGSGFSVSSAGDVNGDGLDDLIVGAFGINSQAGKSYVVFGKTDTNAINLSDIAQGTGGFVINGEKARDYSGRSVSSAGDVNGDGLDDLIVGAYGSDSLKGKSYVIFGKTDTKAINL
ncbi:MAG: hypothetical protein FE834_06975, partial [Gammaproteobacteria bacterium]|nr:hypothetical protein [Gammaproteobacteria bacterium]